MRSNHCRSKCLHPAGKRDVHPRAERPHPRAHHLQSRPSPTKGLPNGARGSFDKFGEFFIACAVPTESPSPALIRPCGRFPWPIPGRGNLEPCGLLFPSSRLCLAEPAKPVPSSSCVRPEPWRHGVLSAPCSVHHSRSSDGWAFATHASDQRPLCQLGHPKPRGTTECRCLRNQSSGIEVPADGHTAESATPGCPRCASAPPPLPFSELEPPGFRPEQGALPVGIRAKLALSRGSV